MTRRYSAAPARVLPRTGHAALARPQLLVLLVLVAVSHTRAYINDWVPSDFEYHTYKLGLGGTITCSEGKVIYFGFGHHLNDQLPCPNSHRAAKNLCTPGLSSCTGSAPDCDGDDEMYMHAVCGPEIYYRPLTLDKPDLADYVTITATCPSGHIMFGFRTQINDATGNDSGAQCLADNRQMCTPGETSCVMPNCQLTGDDERFVSILCTDEPVGAFEAVTDLANTAATAASCPDGMWAIYGFNMHFGSGDPNCDSAGNCCQRITSERTCTSSTYDAWGLTGLVNPASACSGEACNSAGSDAAWLHMLCVCLPGHARLDPAAGCEPCELGQRPDNWRETCVDCAAGTYCPRPDLNAYHCGSNATYCPPKSTAPVNVTAGYFTTGGNATTRTGQAPCEPGTYCVDGERFPCPAGWYSGTAASECLPCPPNTRSSEGDANCTACESYQYSPSNSSRCFGCLNGTSTDPVTGECTNCTAGRWALADDPTCWTCPENTYSHTGAGSCTNCTSGRWSPAESDTCHECPAGMYSRPARGCDTCPPGRFSYANASSTCTVCEAGTYSDANATQCEPCPAGYYCPRDHGPAPFECGGPDVYCPADSVAPLPVPPGNVSIGGASPWLAVGYENCPANSTCIRGVATACGAGYRCTANPGKEAGTDGYREECSNGNAALYCPYVAAGGAAASGHLAPPGYYTLGGRATCTACGAEQYLAGDGTCVACTRCGRYEYESGACGGSSDRVCSACDAECAFGCTGAGTGACLHRGTYLVEGTLEERVCPAGHYCTTPAGTSSRTPCPAGTYGASVGLATSTCDGACAHGFYCPSGSTAPDAVPCDVACYGCTGAGADACVACAPGFVDDSGTCVECGDCGVPNTDASGACAGTTRTTTAPCPDGMYCVDGARVGFCSPGYQCTSGATSPTGTDCGGGHVYCPSGSGAPTPVPSGSYSTPELGSPRRRTGADTCPAGLTCQNGWIVAKSCAQHQIRLPDEGSMWHAIDPAEDGSTFAVVWCDAETAGGQWTVIHASSGGDDEPPFVADTEAVSEQHDSPLSAPGYALPMAVKLALAESATESLLWRSDTEWLRVSAPALGASAGDADGTSEVEVTLTAPAEGGSGTETAVAYMGYRRTSQAAGGDFYISAEPRGAGAVENRASNAAWCDAMYVYSSSPAVEDGDAVYHSAISLGTWTASTPGGACATAEGGGAPMLIAVRRIIEVSDHTSCRAHADANPGSVSGLYTIRTPAGSPVDVWCDMETDGGGWTVLYATSGADDEAVATADGSVFGNALSLTQFNVARTAKASFSAEASETLIKRGSQEWLVVSRAAFHGTFGADSASDVAVTVREAGGRTAAGRMAWATGSAAIANGGDFGLLLGADATFDGHDSAAALLNADCGTSLLYSNSATDGDGDGGYDAGATFGAWTATTSGSCGDGGEGGGVAFLIAVRDRQPLCPYGFARNLGDAPGEWCFGVLDTPAATADAATAACSAADAFPVVVASQLDNDELTKQLRNRAASDGVYDTAAWLGVSDAHVNGSAVWANGAMTNYSNWEDGHSGGVEADAHVNCAVMRSNSSRWEAQACNGTALVACMLPVAKPPRSCKEILDRNPGAASGKHTVWLAGVGATTVVCDMSTDGGGWTVLWATSGADDERAFTADGNVTGSGANPLGYEAYNLPRRAKALLASRRGHTLFSRSATEWIVADHAPVDDGLTSNTGAWAQWPVQLRAAVGASGSVTLRGWLGYSTSATTTGGGDLALSLSRVTRHGADANADLVSASCSDQLVYSLSTAALDGDGTYGSATTLGNWGGSGACDGAEGGGMAMFVAVREADAATPAPTSCADILTADASAASGSYVLYHDALDGGVGAGTTVGCDMETDGGGWDIVYATTGADGEVAATSDDAVTGDALSSEAFNAPRAVKALLGSGAASELLVWRDASTWLRVGDLPASSDGVFGSAFAGVGSHESVQPCTITSSDGSSAPGMLGWSTAASGDGGDLAVLLGEHARFDRSLAGTAPLLNAGSDCAQQLLYSHSSATSDGDAAYGAGATLGSWAATTPGSCGTGAEGSGMALRLGVRRAPRGAWVPLVQAGRMEAATAARMQPATAGYTATAVRATVRDGVFACDGSHSDAAWPWDACGSSHSGAGVGFSLNLLVNDESLLSSPSPTQLPSQCGVAGDDPRGGRITCALGSPLSVVENKVFTTTAGAGLAVGANGAVDLDMEAFAAHTCPPLAATAGPGVTAACASPARWVRIVADAVMTGAGPANTYTISGIAADAGQHRVRRIKAVYQSGYITCDTTQTAEEWGWGACYPAFSRASDGGPLVFFELLRGADLVIEQSSNLHVAGGCTPPPPGREGSGDVVCDTDFTLSAGDTVTPTWFDVRTSSSTSDNGGELHLDLWALVEPESPAKTATATDGVPEWRLLISDAEYTAAGPNTRGYRPAASVLAMGSGHGVAVTAIRAVHRSGYVSCDTGVTQDTEYVWEACGDSHATSGAGGTRPEGFELKLNGEYVLESPDAVNAAASCTQTPRSSGVPAGDFVCGVDFTLVPGDVLTPEYYAAGHGVDTSSRGGSHRVDVWGLVTPLVASSGAGSTAAAISAGDVCDVGCEAGLTLVSGSAKQTCGDDGSWSAASPKCLALASFEATASMLPALHSWSFDAALSPGRVVDDVEGGDALGYIGTGAAVGSWVGGDSKGVQGCAVGQCLHITKCDSGLRSSRMPNVTALGGARPKSLSVWVRVPDAGAGPDNVATVPVLQLGNTEGDACGTSFGLGLRDGVPVGLLGSCTRPSPTYPADIVAPGALGSSAWHHVVLAYDGATARLYVDGVLAGSHAGHLATRATMYDRITIGGDDACNLGVDEVRVFAFGLTGAQVTQLYDAARRCPALTAPAFGSMSCSGTGTRAGDACTFSCRAPRAATEATRVCQADGTWSGDTAACVRLPVGEVDDVSRQPVHWWDFDSVATSGVDGSVLAFPDVGTPRARGAKPLQLAASSAGTSIVSAAHSITSGMDGAVSITRAACDDGSFLAASGGAADVGMTLLGDGPKSLTLWFSASYLSDDGSSVAPLASLGGSRSESDPSCAVDAATNCDGGRLALSHDGGAGGVLVASAGGGGNAAATAPTPRDAWVHAAAVYDGAGMLKLYVDGTSVAEESVAIDAGGWTAGDLVRVGRDSLVAGDASVACNVTVDDVKLYDYALTDTQVAEMSLAGAADEDLYAGAALDNNVALTTPVACAAQHGSVWRDASVSGRSPVGLAMSGEEPCSVLASQTAHTPSVTAGEPMSLRVTYAANDAFRCVAGACPTVQVTFTGTAATVSLEIDEAMAASARSASPPLSDAGAVTATASCSVVVPDGATAVSGLTLGWAVPGVDAGVYDGGRIVVYDVQLVPSGSAGWGHPSAGSMAALPSAASPMDLVCDHVPVHNVRAEAPASCLEQRTLALGGSGFLSTPPAMPWEHLADATAAPAPHTATAFKRRLPATATRGTPVAVLARAVANATSDTSMQVVVAPVRSDTGQTIDTSSVACVSGTTVVRSSGSLVTAVEVALDAGGAGDGAGTASTLTFDAWAASGATLGWQLNVGTSAVASGGLADGVTLDAAGVPTATPCSDATVRCRFTVAVPASAARAAVAAGNVPATLWVSADAAATLANGWEADATAVWVSRVTLATASDATSTAGVGISTQGEGWQAVGVCHVAAVAGGAYVEYTQHITAGPAVAQTKLQHGDLWALESGMYWIDPNGGSISDAVLAHCDHDTDDGGWTLVAAAQGAAITAPVDSATPLGGVALPPVFDDALGLVGAPQYTLGPQAAHLAVSEARSVVVSGSGEVGDIVGNVGAAAGSLADVATASPSGLWTAPALTRLTALSAHSSASSSVASTLPLCDAETTAAAWCSAFCGTEAGSTLTTPCADASLRNISVAGLSEEPGCTGAKVATAAGGCPSIAGARSVAAYVRGAAAPAPAPMSATAVSSALGMAAEPLAGAPLCGSLALGQSPSQAGQSCAHILADYSACADGLAAPPSGLYWLRPAGRAHHAAYLARCVMSGSAGGGWTMVNAPGGTMTSPDGVTPVPASAAPVGDTAAGGGALTSMDLQGLVYDQVLVTRVGDEWCSGAAHPVTDAVVANFGGFDIAVRPGSGDAYALDDAGELVAVPTAAPESGSAWDLSAAEGATAVTASVSASGDALLFTVVGRVAASLEVGSMVSCPRTVRMAVYVRDSGVTASVDATTAAAAHLGGSFGGLREASEQATVLTSVEYDVSQVECASFSVDPAMAQDETHPGLPSAGADVMDPLPQLDYVELSCADPVTMRSSVQRTVNASVGVLTSATPADAATAEFGGARDCADVLALGFTESGWYDVYPSGAAAGATAVSVYCDQTSAGGGWTVVYVSEPRGGDDKAYAVGTEALVAASTRALISFRDEANNDATYSAAHTATWAVLDTPDSWRHAHPATLTAVDEEVLVTLAGEATPSVRTLRYGSDAAPAGDCSVEWGAGSVAGRVCIEGTAAPYWGDFGGSDGAAQVCGASSAGIGACADSRRFSIAVRGGSGGAAPASLAVATPLSRGLGSTASSVVTAPAATADALDLGLPTSCADALMRMPGARNGMYDIAAPMGAGRGRRQTVYCDMEGGGWRLCAVLPAARFHHDPDALPLLSEWTGATTDPARGVPTWAWSSDCGAELEAGALVAMSPSAEAANVASGGAAVLLGPTSDAAADVAAGASASPLVWRASGRAPGGDARTSVVSQFTVAAPGLADGCPTGDGRLHGPTLHTQGTAPHGVCADAGVFAGVHSCSGCSDAVGALGARPHRGSLAVWVQASHSTAFGAGAVSPRLPRHCGDVKAAWPSRRSGPAAVWPNGDDADPVYVECDMGAGGDAWTVVYVSDSAVARSAGAASPAYAPGTEALVASSSEVRLAVSSPTAVATVALDAAAWVALKTPDAWRGAHPASLPDSLLQQWPMRSAAAPSGFNGTVRFGHNAGFGTGIDAGADAGALCAGGSNHSAVLMGRVCAAISGSGSDAVAWGNFAASSGSAGAAVGQLCATASGVDACGADLTFSLAVRHARSRSDSPRVAVEPLPRSCTDVLDMMPGAVSGTYTVYPTNDVRRPAAVFCDMSTAGGGWTVVFDAAPGTVYDSPAGITALDGDVARAHTLEYAHGTAALVNDARNDVLLALRDASGAEVGDVAWAAFALPAAWRVKHPGAVEAGVDQQVLVTVEGGTSTTATLRYGATSTVGSGCAGDWGAAGTHGGRVCIDGTATPLWSHFADGAAAGGQRCGTGTDTALPQLCAADQRHFTIAVRARRGAFAAAASAIDDAAHSSGAGEAAQSCADVAAAGASVSGTYPLFPHSDPEHVAAWRSSAAMPASCAQVLVTRPSAPNGMYTIMPPSGSGPLRVYCDMESGGWMHCGTDVAGSNVTRHVQLGMEAAHGGNSGAATARVRAAAGYSVSCAWALAPGAAVALSSSVTSATGAMHAAATIIGDAHAYTARNHTEDIVHAESTRWAVRGVAWDGTALDELVVATAQGDGACSDTGIALLRRQAVNGAGCGGAAERVDSGVGMCGCGVAGAALQGVPRAWGQTTALWVRPAAPANPDVPVQAYCDLATSDGGWTLVYSTSGDGGGVDGDNSATGLAHRAYLPPLRPLVASASEVLLAMRFANGDVATATVVASLPMPPQWRTAHLSTFHGVDLPNWPVTLDGAAAELRTVRFGSAAVDLAGGEWCAAAWSADASSHGGLVCVAGATASPKWIGWASGADADVCEASDTPSALCTASNAFTIAVR